MGIREAIRTLQKWVDSESRSYQDQAVEASVLTLCRFQNKSPPLAKLSDGIVRWVRAELRCVRRLIDFDDEGELLDAATCQVPAPSSGQRGPSPARCRPSIPIWTEPSSSDGVERAPLAGGATKRWRNNRVAAIMIAGPAPLPASGTLLPEALPAEDAWCESGATSAPGLAVALPAKGNWCDACDTIPLAAVMATPVEACVEDRSRVVEAERALTARLSEDAVAVRCPEGRGRFRRLCRHARHMLKSALECIRG